MTQSGGVSISPVGQVRKAGVSNAVVTDIKCEIRNNGIFRDSERTEIDVANIFVLIQS